MLRDRRGPITDRRVAKIVQGCLELPGQELFTYCDEVSCRHTVESTHVNEYLQETTGKPFTAKDFRTWGGSLLATQVLLHAGDFETMKEGRRRTVQAVKDVAAALGNTPATCRKYYIHPRVLELYETHELERAVRSRRLPPKEVRDHLRDGEIALWRVLTE